MADDKGVPLTVVGGRPAESRRQEAVPGSAGLRLLLRRLAEDPSLANDLAIDPDGTLAAEGLDLTEVERAVLRDLNIRDLEQSRFARVSAVRGPAGEPEISSSILAERQRRGAQLELVAPYLGDADSYMGDRTRGIRPDSIYPTPYAVAEALIRRSETFRTAFLQDAKQAILSSSELPLSSWERQSLLATPVLERLQHIAQNA